MAIRRAPQGFGGPLAAMAGGMTPQGSGAPGAPGQPGMGRGGMSMPRPAMTGAPTGNANPNAQSGIPMAPPPIDLSAGGPTSPMNIDQMLKTNQGAASGGQQGQPGSQPGAPTRRAPLMPWGDSQGEPAAPTDGGGAGTGTDVMGGDMGKGARMAQPGGTGGAGASNDPSQGPLVMLRLLKAMGKL